MHKYIYTQIIAWDCSVTLKSPGKASPKLQKLWSQHRWSLIRAWFTWVGKRGGHKTAFEIVEQGLSMTYYTTPQPPMCALTPHPPPPPTHVCFNPPPPSGICACACALLVLSLKILVYWFTVEGQMLYKSSLLCSVYNSTVGTVPTEIKAPSAENPELTNVLPLKPGVSQNMAMHALPTARNFFLVLISTFLVHSLSFLCVSRSSPYCLTALVLANAASCLGL